MKRSISGYLRHRLVAPEIAKVQRQLREQREQDQRLRVSLGILMARQIAATAHSCADAEFSTFSQYGEDGIIEFLVTHCDLAPERFVEIGVETYDEANTRFLAEHRQWQGLIVDLNPHLVRHLARTKLDWRSQVRAEPTFVTRDNARGILESFVGTGGLGLLSIDVDGVDYWILERLIDLAPALVIVEYNALFGSEAAVSVPYDAKFDRGRAEFHGVYYGASLAAFAHLLQPAGYSLVACSSAGNNAFFVRSERLRDVAALSVGEAFRSRRFVEHRAGDGSLTGTVDRQAQLRDIGGLTVTDVRDGRSLRVSELP